MKFLVIAYKQLITCLLIGVFAIPASVCADSKDSQQEKNSGIFEGKLSLGYRAIAYDRLGRATEYRTQEAGANGLLEVKGWQENNGFSLLADYTDDNDYDVALDANLLSGHLRFWAETEKLQHNLDHYVLPPAAYVDPAVSPAHPGANLSVPWFDAVDRNPGEEYRLTVTRNRVALKAKANYPAHVTLEAWQLHREGEKGLRYLEKSDNSGGNCGQCHVNSRTQKIDQVTNEIKGGVDAHLGYVDVIFEQLYREFKDDAGAPNDTFGDLSGGTLRSAGNYTHDAAAESTLLLSTLRLHSSLSGGLTGAGSVSYGQRENESGYSDLRGVRAESDFIKTAADVGWILSPSWALNFQYRWLDLDNSNSSTLFDNSLGPAGQNIQVREVMDQRRAQYRGFLTHRPCRQTTVKWTYVHEDVERNRTTDDPANPWLWKLPGTEHSDKYRMELLLRPLGNKKLTLDAWYEYQSSDEAAYGSSAKKGQEGFLALSFVPSPSWGGVVNLQGSESENDEHTLALINETASGPAYQRYDLDRSETSVKVNGNLWMNIAKRLSVGTYLSWMKAVVEQDLLFATKWNPVPAQNYAVVAENADSKQQVAGGSIYMKWQVFQGLDVDAEGRHTRSHYRFNPDFADTLVGSLPVSPDGLGDISSFTVYQNSLAAGLSWQPVVDWIWGARYTIDDYESRDDNFYEGTVQNVLVSLTRRW